MFAGEYVSLYHKHMDAKCIDLFMVLVMVSNLIVCVHLWCLSPFWPTPSPLSFSQGKVGV